MKLEDSLFNSPFYNIYFIYLKYRAKRLASGVSTPKDIHQMTATIHSTALGNRTLPPGVEKYKETPVFRTNNMPNGLRRDHATKAWGVLVVTEGNILFHDKETSEERQIDSTCRQVIAPHSVHWIAPSEDAVFHLEFHRVPETTPELENWDRWIAENEEAASMRHA